VSDPTRDTQRRAPAGTPDGSAAGGPSLPAPSTPNAGTGPVATLRGLLEEAVAQLPALPESDPLQRYGLRNLTVLWLEADKSEHTRRAYHGDLADWLGWCQRTAVDPLAARRADIDAWKATVSVTGPDGVVRAPAAATLARRLAGISSWYRYLVSNEAADRNPIDAVRRPRTGDAPPLPALDEAATVRLLAHAQRRAWRNGSEASWRDAALVHLLFHTGLRVSALTTAQVHDLDRDGEHVVLRYWRKGGTRDLVPLVPAALKPLRQYLDLRADRERVAAAALVGPLMATAPRPNTPRSRVAVR
jgi:integrase/recombinase XerD